jgi:hypothetical protein
MVFILGGILLTLGWDPHHWLRNLQEIDVAAVFGASIVLFGGSKSGCRALAISALIMLASIPVWLPGSKL